MFKAEMGKRIQIVRNKLGMTKIDFAEMIEMTDQYLGTVERGKNGITCEKLKLLCDKTGISADYFIMRKNITDKQMEVIMALSEYSIDELEVAFDVILRISSLIKSADSGKLLIGEVFKSYNDAVNDK